MVKKVFELKKGKSEKLSFFKKLGIGILSGLALFGLNERANAALKKSAEAKFYNYLDKGFYNYIDEGQYRGRYNYLDRGMYAVAGKQRYEYLDDWQYRHDNFYFQEMYKDFFRKVHAHTFPAKDGDIFRMPYENPIAQSDYFKMLNGYENPFNTELNFYLVRAYFGRDNRCVDNKLLEIPALEDFPDYDSFYQAKFLSAPVSEYYPSCCSFIFWGGQPSFSYYPVPGRFHPCREVIPEPATIALLGLGGLALLRGRKKKEKEQEKEKKELK